jgi:hypothetical protein
MASTGETKSFLYDGSQESVELLLRGEKTHTEYRVEDLPSTCYRNEVVGYHTVCTGGHYGPYPRPYPHPYPGPHHPGPHPYPRTCYREPIYRQIPYSCIRTVRTPYEVKDFDVDTKVVLNVVRNGEAVPAEKFTVTLRGDQLTLMMDGSKRYVGVVKNESIKEQMAGSVKVIDAVYNVELVDTQEVVAAIQLKRIAMNKGVVELKAGKFADRGDLGLSLTIVKKKALATDEILLDRILTAGEYDAQAEDAIATNIDVNTQALGLNLKGGKFSITAKLFLKGKVLNRIQLPELEASRTLIYKN